MRCNDCNKALLLPARHLPHVLLAQHGAGASPPARARSSPSPSCTARRRPPSPTWSPSSSPQSSSKTARASRPTSSMVEPDAGEHEGRHGRRGRLRRRDREAHPAEVPARPVIMQGQCRTKSIRELCRSRHGHRRTASSIMLGGFGPGTPHNLIKALYEQGTRKTSR